MLHFDNFIIFQTFSLLFYLLCWSMISDLWCYHCNCFWVPRTVSIWDSKLNQQIHVFWLFHWPAISQSLSSLPPCPQATCFLKHNNVEMRSINNSTVSSKCSNERKSHTSLFLNQKLRNELSLLRKVLYRAKAGWKLGLLCQLAMLWMQRKSPEGN